jgi:hypothetical protein
MQENDDFFFVEKVRRWLKPKRIIKVGDVGIYQDVLNINTMNDGTHSLNYDMYVKVKAVAIFENLVEIEVIDVMTTNSNHQEVRALVESNIPKYIKPKYVKWEASK